MDMVSLVGEEASFKKSQTVCFILQSGKIMHALIKKNIFQRSPNQFQWICFNRSFDSSPNFFMTSLSLTILILLFKTLPRYTAQYFWLIPLFFFSSLRSLRILLFFSRANKYCYEA